MNLGIYIEGEFAPSLVIEKIMEMGASLHVFPAEYGLDLPRPYPVELDMGYGSDAAGERVFRIVNKADALLVFADKVDRGIVWAAIKKARNYSMPVVIVRSNGETSTICDKPSGGKARKDSQQNRVNYRRRREEQIAAAGRLQTA